MTAHVLNIDSLSIALPPGADRSHAVQNVNLVLRPGEVTCLVGESGSGKSMVARAIMRLLPSDVKIDGGALDFDGIDLARADSARMRTIRGAEIGMVFQEPMTALNPLHRVGHQVDEVLQLHTQLGRAARHQRVLELFEETLLPEPERIYRSYPHQLSGGQRQRAMISMALALRPKLLIADEPTTALDVTTQAQILHLLNSLRYNHGTAVLFITHDFGVVAEIADQVAVLQRGSLVEQGRRDDVLQRPKHPYTRELLSAVPRIRSLDRSAPKQTAPILEVRQLNKTYPRPGFRANRIAALDQIEFRLHKGETLGLVGESGSGKSTLARVISCLARADSGEIKLDNEPIADLTRRQLRPYRKRIQMVFQDPNGSLDPRQRVGDIVAEGPIIHGADRYSSWERAKELLVLVGLEPSAASRYPHEFSGGQRQRIGIARALALEPEILVADEPVSALDVSVQAQVLRLLDEVKQRLSLSMLFVTHDLRVALQVCDRIAVMQRGKIVEIATARELFEAPKDPYTRRLFAAIPGVDREPDQFSEAGLLASGS